MKKKIFLAFLFMFFVLVSFDYSFAVKISATNNSFTFFQNEWHYQLNNPAKNKLDFVRHMNKSITSCNPCREKNDFGIVNTTHRDGNLTVQDAINKYYKKNATSTDRKHYSEDKKAAEKAFKKYLKDNNLFYEGASQNIKIKTWDPVVEAKSPKYVRCNNNWDLPTFFVSLTYTWEPIDLNKNYQLTLKANPEEGGEVSGAGTYKSGEKATINAVPNEGYKFVRWEKDGAEYAKDAKRVIEMPGSNLTLVARFEEVKYKLELRVEPGGVATPIGGGSYKTDSTVNIGLKDIEAHYGFIGWYKPDGTFVTDSIDHNITITEDTILIAKFKKNDHIHIWEEPDWDLPTDEEIENDPNYSYIEKKVGEMVNEDYEHNDSSMNPDRCPDINNISGNRLEKLFYIGERLNLSGTLCKHVSEYEATTYIVTCNKPYVDYKDGKEVTRICGEDHIMTRGDSSNSIVYDTDNLTINIDGIILVDSNGNEVNSGIKMTEEEWKTNDFFVREWKNVHYSAELGTAYGIITVISACPNRCTQTYYVPGPRDIPKNVPVNIHLRPSDGGSVTVEYQKSDEAGNIITYRETFAKDSVIMAIEGSTVKVIVSENPNYRHWKSTKDEAGLSFISDKNEYEYTVPKDRGDIFVFFKEAKSYTLYVTSTIGGRAYIEECPEEYRNRIEKSEVNGIYVELIRNVEPDSKFKIKYEGEEGYSFKNWTYRPFIFGDENGRYTDISMPESDLTVTAMFIPNKPEKTENPILTVTVNNEEWGAAYAVINGSPIKVSEVTPGEYPVYYVPNTGYYFTNWEYSSLITPFKDIENIEGEAIFIMPSHDLEIKAIFAPIPENDKVNKYSVEFRAEPPEGGDVPQDIDLVPEGEKVTIAVTPHKGYVFDYWKFYDVDGNELPLDKYYDKTTGTGYFIMPSQPVVAVAYFKKASIITIQIIGEGTVIADGVEVQSGDIIEKMDGEIIDFISTPDENWQIKYYVTKDGEVLGEIPSLEYIVNGDETIFIVFEYIGDKDKKGPYTLYVSSLYGGDAWIEEVLKKIGDYDYKIEKEGPDDLGKYVYKIKDVYAGDRFSIKYEVTEEGYSFDKWEHKPFIESDFQDDDKKTGVIEITMPASDLTVTAIFKNDEIRQSPLLSITTNNVEWGSAWTTIDGTKTVHDKKYEAAPTEKYTLEYKAEAGYYFVGWQYSTTETPFISSDVIVMPPRNLEVMAMFSPIPEPGPGPVPPAVEGHKIKFEAEPPEGGRVPDDLENILPGSLVTIGVTVNKGWEFSHWIFKDPNGNIIKNITTGTDSTGSGYFVMPDYDVIAIAVFKEKASYTLYVTHYYGGDAWTIDNDNVTEVTEVKKAYVGELYPLYYSVMNGYEFVNWEFRWDKYGEALNSGSINPMSYVDKGYAVMPASDMTVTAVFKEINPTKEASIMVSTNNPLWGDAWIVINGVEYHSEWINAIPGETYEVYYKPHKGFEFTNWSTIEYFEEYVPGVYRAILKMPDDKIEIMAFFKPGEDEENTFVVNVSADPKKLNGNVSVGNSGNSLSGIRAGEKVRIIAQDADGYKFNGWYIIIDGVETLFSKKKDYVFTMPARDINLIAKYQEKRGTSREEEKDKYTVIVNKSGDGSGTIRYKYNSRTISKTISSYFTGEVFSFLVDEGSKVEFFATPDENNSITKWEKNGATLSGTEITVFEDVVIEIGFGKNPEKPNYSPEEAVLRALKIVSIRDLNWKDYFTEKGTLREDRFFGIPTKNTTIVQNDGKFVQPIKMGYAVEFELITEGIALNNAELVIKPKVYEAVGNEINPNVIKLGSRDLLRGNLLKSELESLKDSKYKEVRINKSTNGKGSFMGEAIDLEEKTKTPNGIVLDKNAILWRWVYYLPMDTYVEKGNKEFSDSNELLVNFDIELYEGGKKAKDIVVHAQKIGNSSWDGKVFRYSLKESALDDIYNNAQN